MRKALLLPVAALALTGLAACGQKAKNEAAEANEAMAGDSNTMGEAVSDVNAAQAAAFDDAENAYAGNASEADGNEITD
ncbi:hypothetical protein [Sphingomonas sp. dw_22]|uniref:hypothetical protein n=1 Tax=Sphingomonas sp. dw_22 TaxID=2721175 RepID=UPI001BD6C8F1|nr:hypothetical protein [Sphingomonas sp. dw_22]